MLSLTRKLLGVVILLTAAPHLHATTVDQLELADTVRIADVVVQGTIGQPEAMKLETPQYSIWMKADTLTVNHVYVGSVEESTIKVCHPGGLTFSDGYSIAVPTGFPTQQPGDQVIFMLEEKAGYYVVTGLYQGKWELSAEQAAKTGEGPAIYAHQGRGDANLVDEATKQKAMPSLFQKTIMLLSELEAEIEQAAQDHGKPFTAAKSAPVLTPSSAKSAEREFTYLKVNEPLRPIGSESTIPKSNPETSGTGESAE
ncbi:MAG: hypothetical protein ACFCU1_12065 [Sumerlaeia bacterium]